MPSTIAPESYLNTLTRHAAEYRARTPSSDSGSEETADQRRTKISPKTITSLKHNTNLSKRRFRNIQTLSRRHEMTTMIANR